MKRLILTLAVLAAPGLAFAQTPEATIPQDAGRSAEWTVTPSAQVAPDVAAVWLDPDQRIAAAKETLREVIASAMAGNLTHPNMSAGLAQSFETQQETLVPIVQGFGALGEIRHAGLENGAERFHVSFEKAQTEWVIGFNDDGKIGLLLFRPAEPEVTDAPPPTDPAPASE